MHLDAAFHLQVAEMTGNRILKWHLRMNMDTTIKTVFGNQQGARKGYNTKHRGKHGLRCLRSVLVFIEQTREYLTGKQRKGATITVKKTAALIADIEKRLPGCVQEVLIRADGEFMSWDSIKAAMERGFDFIIANRGCNPRFDADCCYRQLKRKEVKFNNCFYQPAGWGQACRFVAMRSPKAQKRTSNQPCDGIGLCKEFVLRR